MSEEMKRGCQATQPKELERQIMSSLVPKNEREHWAAREIESLREQVELLRESMDAINSTGIDRAPKWTGMNARDIARLALAATEPK